MWVGIGVGIGRNRFATGIFNAYALRVTADGGITEAGQCVDAVTGLLLNASLLLIPSGYKGGKLYAEIPTNGNGDLTWTRGSDAFRTNADGLIQRVPWNLATNSEGILSTYATNTNVTNASSSFASFTNAIQFPSTGLSLAYKSIVTTAQLYCISVFIKMDDNSTPILSSSAFSGNLSLVIGGSVVTNNLLVESYGNNVYRLSGTATSSGVNLNNGVVRYDTQVLKSFKISGIQLVEGTTAQTYFPTTDRLNVPRLSYMYGSCPAALLEPQRTNSIRNSVCGGASTSPSTYPTNWSAGSTGLTQTVVAIGTENGLTYVDLRFNGTASTTLARITPEISTSISATNNQSWTVSTYAKLISGTYDSSAIGFIMRNSGGTSLGLFSGTTTLTSTLQRFNYVATTNNASTVYVHPFIDFYVTSGVSYDFTIRIAQPQMELGAYVTTPIFTSGATATRVADSFSRSNIYTNGLISASGGTWFVELRNNVEMPRVTGYPTLFISSNTAGSSSLTFGIGTSVTPSRLFLYYDISSVFRLIGTTTTDNVKIAFTFTTTTLKVYVNGSVFASYTGLTIDPTTIQNLIGKAEVSLFIQQMALFPSPLSDSDCQTLTT